MDLYVLDKSLNAVHYLDSFESLIWTERYYECGDFEIHSTINKNLLENLQQEYFLYSNDSDTVMIIEQREIVSDVEDGSKLIISGRSLEAILERRIVWNKTVLNGSFQDGIELLLNENIISPTIHSRKIENFIFEKSGNERILGLKINETYHGDDLYTIISTLCKNNSVGFKIRLNSENQFVFSLFDGVDRSYAQSEIPCVIFSPSFDNIINSNYVESKQTLRTVALISYDKQTDESSNDVKPTMIVELNGDGGNGLDRRETFVEASGISSSDPDVELTEYEYEEMVRQRGIDELKANIETKSFEGEVESSQVFCYRTDFGIGDIVQVLNEYGVEARTRVVEFIISQDVNGIDTYPTFETVQEVSASFESKYYPVEYLESNGSQFIDTKIPASNDLKISINYATDSASNSCIVGSCDNTTTKFAVFSDTIQCGNKTFNVTSYSEGIVNICLSAKELCKNDTVVENISTDKFTINSSVYLFALNNNGSVNKMSAIKLYSCKIYSGSVLVRDFIPARDTDDVACLYDKVSQQYFYNSGSGEFAAPNNTHTFVDYIESTGTQYIDTLFVPNQDTRVVASTTFLIEKDKGSNRKCLFGTGDNTHRYRFDTWNGKYWVCYEWMRSGFKESVSFVGRFSIDMNKNVATITGGDELKFTRKEFSASHSLLIFADHADGQITSFSSAKIYYFRLYNNGTLIRDYVPVIDGDGVACLYDKLNHRYYRNAGTGEFLTS